MSPEEYREIREKIGTQEAVAGLLGLKRLAVVRREAGDSRITEEAAIAISALARDARKQRPSNANEQSPTARETTN